MDRLHSAIWDSPFVAQVCRAYAEDIESALIHGWLWKTLFQNYKKQALKTGIKNPMYTSIEEVIFITGSGVVYANDLKK